MVLVAQRYTYSVPRHAPHKLPQLVPSHVEDGSSSAPSSASPVFSFEDDPSGAPHRPARDRRAVGAPEPKAKRTLLPIDGTATATATATATVTAATTVGSGIGDSTAVVDGAATRQQPPEDAWALAQKRVKDREEQWRHQQAAERIQKHARARAARAKARDVRKQKQAQQCAAQREAAAAVERAEQERAAAEAAEAARLQDVAAAAAAARVVEQRRVEALQSRVESQRQRRKQRLELNRAATNAARDALPPDASAKEVAVSRAMSCPRVHPRADTDNDTRSGLSMYGAVGTGTLCQTTSRDRT